MKYQLREYGIAAELIDIEDFNENDLKNKLSKAVDTLKGMLDEGLSVYVSCNAGMGLSPAVVVGYMVRY